MTSAAPTPAAADAGSSPDGSAPPPSAPRTTAEKIEDLRRRHRMVTVEAAERATDKQHAKGKLSARERIDLLLDPGSFVEVDEFARARDGAAAGPRPYGDGVVTGLGTVDGRQIAVFSQDFSVFGGTLGEAFGQRVIKVQELAMKIGCPLVGINDSGGARIQEGVAALAYYCEIGYRNAQASGVIPQISVIAGPCAGGAVYTPAITDFTVMVDRTAHMFVTGPEVLRAVTGEDVTVEELGGALANVVSGNAHHLATDEKDAFDYVKHLLSFLPSNNLEPPPLYDEPADPAVTVTDLELERLVPDAPNAGYDMCGVIHRVVDGGEFFEVQPLYAPNLLCGFARVEGRPIGIVANQPLVGAGAIDIDASEKGARFVRFCDAFNLPLLFLVDVPGYLPGMSQERMGIIRRGTKLPFAYAEATVPKVTVVIRKAYGGGYAVMGSKHLGADLNLAWPTAEVAVMGAEGAVNLLHRRDLVAAGADAPALRERLLAQYRETFGSPYLAAERGFIDAVIEPAHTRMAVARGLRVLRTKHVEVPRRKHHNMPL